MAKLIFYFGTMASGKSAHLIAVAGNYGHLGKKVLLLKPRIDTRSEAVITSRLNIFESINHYVEDSINEEWLVDIACILVDEAQFLSVGAIDQLRKITITHDIPCLCYGLRTDYQLNLFPGSRRLFEVADSITEVMKTICAHCAEKKAIVNHRKIKTEGQILIGDNIYESICYSCYSQI